MKEKWSTFYREFTNKDRSTFEKSGSNCLRLRLTGISEQPNLSGLEEIALFGLAIEGGVRKIDLKIIESIRGLHLISLFATPSLGLDLSMLECLKVANIEKWPESETILKSKSLRYLSAWKFGYKNFPLIERLISISAMTIRQFRGETLESNSKNESLEYLELLLPSNLKSLAGIESFPKLKTLRIVAANKLSDISSVKFMSQLSTVSLDDCPNIASLSCIENNESLNSFSMFGRTRVKDSNLSPLKTLRNIKDLRIEFDSQFNVQANVSEVERQIKKWPTYEDFFAI